MSSPPPRLAPEALLDGRYRIKALLGEGGMGRVYAAEDIRLSRRVAIKVLREGSRDESASERLFREAKAAARVDHPAIVTTFTYGTDCDTNLGYLVMEYLRGETVGQRVARAGPLGIALVMHVAHELADALAAVHAQGVVHRDLKPSNVFLATRGRRVDEIRLLDFGVSKQLDLESLTATGQVYGTPMYMAPEQLADSKHVDARCDVYALGAVLVECLIGRAPFTASHIVGLIAEIRRGITLDLCAVRPDTPKGLAAVIDTCMQRDPGRRFSDGQAVYDALRALGA